jgi:hypothetical protein
MTAHAPSCAVRHIVRRAVVAAAHQPCSTSLARSLFATLFSQRRTAPGPQWHHTPPRGAIEAHSVRCIACCAVHMLCAPQAALRRALVARRARGRVLLNLLSVATRCAAACGAPPRMQHLSRCCAANSMRHARLQPRSAHASDANNTVLARRRDALGAGRRGAASVAGADSQVHSAAPSAARQRSRKRTPRALRA